MDISKFLELRPSWAMEPHVYIIQHPALYAYRCGASGTHLYKESDQVYGAERATYTGLLGRCQLYKGFFLPMTAYIHAALRVKRQLVANPKHRTSTDFTGRVYNITKGQHTLVLEREAEFHQELDKKGLRWRADKQNELFVPEQRGVIDLIESLRTIQGEELHLFETEDIILDTTYTGGVVRTQKDGGTVIDTGPRQLPPRPGKDQTPTIKIKLSKDAIEILRRNDPAKYNILLDIVKAAILQKENPPTTPTPAPAPAPAPVDVDGPVAGPGDTTGAPATPEPPPNRDAPNPISVEPRRSRRLMEVAMTAQDIQKLRKGDKKAQKIARALAALS